MREFQYKVLAVADPRFDFRGAWSLLIEGGLDLIANKAIKSIEIKHLGHKKIIGPCQVRPLGSASDRYVGL